MRRLAVFAALALFVALGVRAAFADRLAIWNIVNTQCAPAAAKGEPLPAPCLAVDKRSATIKDRKGDEHLLVIPTERIAGIEDRALLAPDAPAIFAEAWSERALLRKYLPSAPQGDGLGFTVNSAEERTQDQLHVHVDCLKPEVAKTLAAFMPGPDWAPMGEALAGHTYFARAVPDLTTNPFKLLSELPVAAAEMGEWTLAVVPQADHFVLLAGRHGGPGGGHSEDILDVDCAIARGI